MINSRNGEHLLEKIGIEEDYMENKIRSLRSDQSSILIHPKLVETTLKRLKETGVDFVVVTKNLQKDIEEERKPSSVSGDWFESYHTFEEILQWLKTKSIKHDKYCSLHDIGNSYHNKPLRVIKIVGEPNQCKKKPSIWIDSGIHAREWISHSTGMYLIERILEDYQNDPFVRYMRDTYDWYFLLVLNPDGYEYSWTDNRMWRKSRSPNSGSSCIGTDINRNFDHYWMTIGASNDSCSELYAGSKPFSELEGKAVADFVLKKKEEWDLFITLHSHGHLWLTPWGYTTQLPDNYPQLEKVGRAAVDAIKNFSGINYRLGSASNILYTSSGTSRDWAKGVPKIPLVYTVELRNDSSFILPPSEIIPTGIEIWRALKACVKTMEGVLPPLCKHSPA